MVKVQNLWILAEKYCKQINEALIPGEISPHAGSGAIFPSHGLSPLITCTNLVWGLGYVCVFPAAFLQVFVLFSPRLGQGTDLLSPVVFLSVIAIEIL